VHGNYHVACLSRSYRHMHVYKHSKLQRMEITTLRAFLGLIETFLFKTLQVSAHGNYHSMCLSRSDRHMLVYKHSKFQLLEITTPCAFLGLIDIFPFTNTPSYNAWKIPIYVPL
jgi:hypothetical protein